MRTPLVSVILPFYNAEKYIGEAVKSIIDQSFRDFELIIVNDGSTDGSLRKVEEFNDERIVLINKKNHGLAATLNIALKLAKGNLIARMDADDIALNNRLFLQVRAFSENTELVLLGTGVNYINDDGQYICRSYPLMGDKAIKKFLLNKGNVIAHPTVMFKKDPVLDLGGYSEEIGQYFEDHYLWCTLINKGKFDNLVAPLLNYRLTPGAISGVASNVDNFNEKVLNYINKKLNGDPVDLEFVRDRKGLINSISYEEKLSLLEDRIELLKVSEKKILRILNCIIFLNEETKIKLLSYLRFVIRS